MASWKAAYRGIIADKTLDDLRVTDQEARHRAHLMDAQNRSRRLVCEIGGRIVAFATYGPDRWGEPAEVGELQALYAEPDSWNSGAGHALVTVVFDELRAAGCREVVVWVLDENARARRFYEREGFTFETGGVALEGYPVTQARYRRALIEGHDLSRPTLA